MRLQDKVAIVTGAASGIGRSIAVLFAREGARIIVADIDEKGIEGTLSEIKRNGGVGLGIPIDVSNSAQVSSMVERAVSQFARVDVLVNNAGIEMKGSVASLGESDWDRVMNTNLKGVYLCSHFVIPDMAKRRQGVIINMASDLGMSPIPNVAAYAATKGGIIALTKAMAKDHAKDGIRVNCLAPGPIETPLLRRFQPEEILKFVKEVMIPMGRLGTPEEVASAALFLASDEASFINGAIVTVNGGLVS